MTTSNGVSCRKQICHTTRRWILQKECKQQTLTRRPLEHRNQPLKGWDGGPSKSEDKRICYRCRRTGHPPANCKFKEAVCHACKKKGHIASACRYEKQWNQEGTSRRRKRRPIASRTSSNREKTIAAVMSAFWLKSGIARRTQSKSKS